MSTYTPIASITLASASSSVTFSGIPQTYTDLVLVAQVRTTTFNGVDINVDVNGDTGSNYSTTSVRGNGSTASSARTSNGTYFSIDNLSIMNTSDWSITRLNFQNYSNAVTNKTVLARTDRAGAGTSATVNLWRSTSAVTSIRFTCGADQYASGSTFNLYGIDASLSAQAKATGGSSIYTDGTYWYHIFTSSGIFTPTQNLSNVDYLVVAGGGGAQQLGGGGGAGGLRSTVTATGGGGSLESKVSFTNGTSYTITVGAGGAAVNNVNTNSPSGSNSSISGAGFTTITSIGGGGGNGYNSSIATSSGGSGGGGNRLNATAGGAGTANQGYAGGTGGGYSGSGSDVLSGAGGGGGAGAVGGSYSGSTSGSGGAGVAVSITGSSVTYAGGGGGGAYNGTAGGGGAGGGGAGGNTTNNGVAGTVNTGGGAGGGGAQTADAKSGGSGIVVIRYSAA